MFRLLYQYTYHDNHDAEIESQDIERGAQKNRKNQQSNWVGNNGEAMSAWEA